MAAGAHAKWLRAALAWAALSAAATGAAEAGGCGANATAGSCASPEAEAPGAEDSSSALLQLARPAPSDQPRDGAACGGLVAAFAKEHSARLLELAPRFGLAWRSEADLERVARRSGRCGGRRAGLSLLGAREWPASPSERFEASASLVGSTDWDKLDDSVELGKKTIGTIKLPKMKHLGAAVQIGFLAVAGIFEGFVEGDFLALAHAGLQIGATLLNLVPGVGPLLALAANVLIALFMPGRKSEVELLKEYVDERLERLGEQMQEMYDVLSERMNTMMKEVAEALEGLYKQVMEEVQQAISDSFVVKAVRDAAITSSSFTVSLEYLELFLANLADSQLSEEEKRLMRYAKFDALINLGENVESAVFGESMGCLGPAMRLNIFDSEDCRRFHAGGMLPVQMTWTVTMISLMTSRLKYTVDSPEDVAFLGRRVLRYAARLQESLDTMDIFEPLKCDFKVTRSCQENVSLRTRVLENGVVVGYYHFESDLDLAEHGINTSLFQNYTKDLRTGRTVPCSMNYTEIINSTVNSNDSCLVSSGDLCDGTVTDAPAGLCTQKTFDEVEVDRIRTITALWQPQINVLWRLGNGELERAAPFFRTYMGCKNQVATFDNASTAGGVVDEKDHGTFAVRLPSGTPNFTPIRLTVRGGACGAVPTTFQFLLGEFESYFVRGVPMGWKDMGLVTLLSGNPNASLPTRLFTGSNGGGLIFNNNTNVVASSYKGPNGECDHSGCLGWSLWPSLGSSDRGQEEQLTLSYLETKPFPNAGDTQTTVFDAWDATKDRGKETWTTVFDDSDATKDRGKAETDFRFRHSMLRIVRRKCVSSCESGQKEAYFLRTSVMQKGWSVYDTIPKSAGATTQGMDSELLGKNFYVFGSLEDLKKGTGEWKSCSSATCWQSSGSSGTQKSTYDVLELHDWEKVLEGGLNWYAYDKGRNATDALFMRSRVLHRYCSYCADTHQNIYYHRISDIPPEWSLYENLKSWRSKSNLLGVDFNLYSSWDDLASGRNPWTSCNYDDPPVGAFRDCGPTGSKPAQWSPALRYFKYEVLKTGSP